MQRAGPPPSRVRMLARALAKHCPLCGGGRLFDGWFRMKERCPRCGYLFEREEGFFLGAYVINLAIAQAMVILLSVVPLILRLASDPDAGILPFVVGGAAGAVVAPIVFYPWSKTVWTAFDLILRPVGAGEPGDRTGRAPPAAANRLKRGEERADDEAGRRSPGSAGWDGRRPLQAASR